MRIDKIGFQGHPLLGNAEWFFPGDFAVLYLEDPGLGKALCQLLQEYYDDRVSLAPADKQKSQGLAEILLSGEQTGLDMTFEAIRQSGFMVWPDANKHELYRRVSNLQQVGNEELSLARVRDALARAKERVEEQADGMAQVKAEYDALRRDWEEANHRQEEQRFLQIKIKNLQAEQHLLTEKIAEMEKVQQRLSILRENSDYRELRRLQGELARLEELRRDTGIRFTAVVQDKQVDWDMIEGLREECYAWALIQKEAEQGEALITRQTRAIHALQDSLTSSGYRQMPENEEQYLRSAEEELRAAQKELEGFAGLADTAKELERSLLEEKAKLKKYVLIAGVTDKDRRSLDRSYIRLKKWQDSVLGRMIDRRVIRRFGTVSIEDRLASRLTKLLQKYQAPDYQEFMQQIEAYQNQKQAVNQLQTDYNVVRKEAAREEELLRIILSRGQQLQQAFKMVNAADFSSWKNGWDEYRQKTIQIAGMLEALKVQTGQQKETEQKLQEYASQLREKLQNRISSDADIDEVLEAVLLIARELRIKEETEKEYDMLKKQYDITLNKRNLDHLSRTLEPLAELEREECLPEKERLAGLAASRQALSEKNNQLLKARKDLQDSQAVKMDPALEKKLGNVKQQWQAYQELQHTLDDTTELLEASLQKWQAENGILLKIKAQRFLSRTFSLTLSDKKEIMMAKAYPYYFAYRLALAEAALEESSTEIPLFFLSGIMNGTEEFWKKALACLQELSRFRQVIFCTADAGLRKIADQLCSNKCM
jgi:exonuclease SbcC